MDMYQKKGRAPKQITDRNIEYLLAFCKHKGFNKAADHLGVSRQAVEQTVIKFLNVAHKMEKYQGLYEKVLETKRKYINHGDHTGEKCAICGRDFGNGLEWNKGMCRVCYKNSINPPKHGSLLLRRKNCVTCGIPFNRKISAQHRKPGDLCYRCYSKTDKFKQYQKESRERHHEKRLAGSRKYHQEHKEELRIKRKIWKQNHREQDRACQRKRYHAKKQAKANTIKTKSYYSLLLNKTIDK